MKAQSREANRLGLACGLGSGPGIADGDDINGRPALVLLGEVRVHVGADEGY
jgi:hypothetical protein